MQLVLRGTRAGVNRAEHVARESGELAAEHALPCPSPAGRGKRPRLLPSLPFPQAALRRERDAKILRYPMSVGIC